jgi:CheY-like chemotaxis protein
MGGVEALPILKQIRPKLPIIVLSSNASPEVSQQIAEIGVFYHFTKPVNPSDMLQVVRAIEGSRRNGRR